MRRRQAPGDRVSNPRDGLGALSSTTDYITIAATLGGCEAVIVDSYTVEPFITIEEFVGCDSVVYENHLLRSQRFRRPRRGRDGGAY